MWRLLLCFPLLLLLACSEKAAESAIPPEPSASADPMPLLLENAYGYINPANGLIEPISGYPFEGWNDEPERGLFLRNFTQITAIGEWIELLANIAGGQAPNAYISETDALTRLQQVVSTLRRDQQDPSLSSMGLLVNFLGFEGERRVGPLTQSVQRQYFLDEFGAEQGAAIWDSLLSAKWLKPQNENSEGLVLRSATYGSEHFTGALADYADPAMIARIMGILDKRVVLVAYGDNANLSTSVAKTIGALLVPHIADNPTTGELRRMLADFLEAQAPGYRSLVDEEAGMFSFGRDETTGRFFGWNDIDDKWVVGHQDYLVNEFRDPTTFLIARYGLSPDLLRNLGFKIRSYDCADGRTLFALVPYEGSAFQAFGLDLAMPLGPVRRELLVNAVDIHLDYATRHQLPGFLSESYSGEGTEYTGRLGLPGLAVSSETRLTRAPSLYALGTAYQIAPEKVSNFLKANWPTISSLFTDHGPWEGYHVDHKEPIAFQTTAHTLSLILGGLGKGPGNMARYLKAKDLVGTVQKLQHHGAALDLLSPAIQTVSWASDGAATTTEREGKAMNVRCESAGVAGIVFSFPEGGASLAGGFLQLRYRSLRPVEGIVIKPIGAKPLPSIVIPIEIQTRFVATGDSDQLLRIPLPAVAGLTDLIKLELNFQGSGKATPAEFALREFSFTP